MTYAHYYYNVVLITRPTQRTFLSFQKMMAELPATRPTLQNPGRRSLLWSLAGLGLTTKLTTKMWGSEQHSDHVFRFSTPECEVRMLVHYFANTSSDNLRFRDGLTNRAFCLSPNGEEDHACIARFVGAMAIARYDFHSRSHSRTPINLRERVLTIDHDSRMSPRPPFERVLSVEGAAVSDIQAFGYNPGDPNASALPVWCLLRQDLYLNAQTSAFLIVHWKHTLASISLVDVIPGDGTELMSK